VTVGYLSTAGEELVLESELPWVGDLIAEGAAGELSRRPPSRQPTVCVRVEAERQPFDTRGWDFLTRGAWSSGEETVVANACTSGFDVRVEARAEVSRFTFRWRPPARDRAAARVLRSRFHLLARAVLMQYPALWWAGTRGRVPLHASACGVGPKIQLFTAPSGVGRSTLLLQNGGRATTGDNLAVGDGTLVWGLVEPARVEGAAGRKMAHGRSEAAVANRVSPLAPEAVVVLARAHGREPKLVPCSSNQAARSLVTSTYMAGELRRYWAFAATLSAGTGVGPAHPPVADVAAAFAGRLPCFVLELGAKSDSALAELAIPAEVAA
jgi:hypothetical protein